MLGKILDPAMFVLLYIVDSRVNIIDTRLHNVIITIGLLRILKQVPPTRAAPGAPRRLVHAVKTKYQLLDEINLKIK